MGVYPFIVQVTGFWCFPFLFYKKTTGVQLLVKAEKTHPAGNYLFKVNNRNTRTRCEICSKLTIKAPEQSQDGQSTKGQ